MKKRLAEINKRMEELEVEEEKVTLEFHEKMKSLSNKYNNNEINICTLMTKTEKRTKSFTAKIKRINKEWDELEQEAIELVGR